MRTTCCAVMAVACLTFFITFFLPTSSERSAKAQFLWAAEAHTSLENVTEKLAFSGVAVVVAYPYVTSLLIIFACIPGALRRWLETPWLYLACHSLASLVFMALGILLLVLRDEWVPKWMQLVCAFLPPAILGIMWSSAFFARKPRGTWLIVAMGLLPMPMIQFFLVRQCLKYTEAGWAYALGGAASLVALVCAIIMAVKSPSWNLSPRTGGAA